MAGEPKLALKIHFPAFLMSSLSRFDSLRHRQSFVQNSISSEQNQEKTCTCTENGPTFNLAHWKQLLKSVPPNLLSVIMCHLFFYLTRLRNPRYMQHYITTCTNSPILIQFVIFLAWEDDLDEVVPIQCAMLSLEAIARCCLCTTKHSKCLRSCFLTCKHVFETRGGLTNGSR